MEVGRRIGKKSGNTFASHRREGARNHGKKEKKSILLATLKLLVLDHYRRPSKGPNGPQGRTGRGKGLVEQEAGRKRHSKYNWRNRKNAALPVGESEESGRSSTVQRWLAEGRLEVSRNDEEQTLLRKTLKASEQVPSSTGCRGMALRLIILGVRSKQHEEEGVQRGLAERAWRARSPLALEGGTTAENLMDLCRS